MTGNRLHAQMRRPRLGALICAWLICLGAAASCRATAPPPTATTASTGSGSSTSPLKRHDLPPSGVASQFDWSEEGDGGEECPVRETPSIEPYPGNEDRFKQSVRILDQPTYCLSGFSSHSPLTVEMQSPAGKRETFRVSAQPYAATPTFSVLFLPSDPPGEYTLVARQRGLQATRHQLVKLATDPDLVAAPVRYFDPGGQSQPGPKAGEPVEIAIAGFQANSKVTLHIYGQEHGETYTYRTSLSVKIDKDGEATFRLPTQADDPKGCYFVVWKKPDYRGYFCI
jgi:hypothetical protein